MSGGGGGTYQEQGVGVQGKTGCVETESVEPALGVLESAQHVAPREAFVVGGIAVCGEPRLDDGTLLAGQEAGRFGVVVDEEVGTHRNYDGGQTFLNCTHTWSVNLVPFTDVGR